MNRMEIEDYCAKAVAEGTTQRELCRKLGITRSTMSRRVRAGLERLEPHGFTRFINTERVTLSQMMWHRMDVAGRDDCWDWLGSVKADGYGSLNFKGSGHNAHRLVYEILVGEIPDGMTVDHKCSNRSCVNPRHLQITTHADNVILGTLRRAGVVSS